MKYHINKGSTVKSTRLSDGSIKLIYFDTAEIDNFKTKKQSQLAKICIKPLPLYTDVFINTCRCLANSNNSVNQFLICTTKCPYHLYLKNLRNECGI